MESKVAEKKSNRRQKKKAKLNLNEQSLNVVIKPKIPGVSQDGHI